MQTYLLVHNERIIATTTVSSEHAARNYFFDYCAFLFGEIVSKDDYLKQMKNESDLNALENQSPEC
jgi:hypothetical protein